VLVLKLLTILSTYILKELLLLWAQWQPTVKRKKGQFVSYIVKENV